MSKKTLEKIRDIASGKEAQAATIENAPTEGVGEASETTTPLEVTAAPAAKPKRKSSKKKAEET